MLYHYLIVGTSPYGYEGQVTGSITTISELTSGDTAWACFLLAPEPWLPLGYRYLGSPSLGVTTLADDFASLFEAPPEPGCYWNGSQWVYPFSPEGDNPPSPGCAWDGTDWVCE